MPSKKASSAGNQQERSVNGQIIEVVLLAIIAIVLLVISYLIGDFVFYNIIDKTIVPIFGMRPVFAATTVLCFMIIAGKLIEKLVKFRIH